MKLLMLRIPNDCVVQLMLLYTSRANAILADFIRDVFWARYAGGYSHLTTDDARKFVEQSIDNGKTSKRWAESTVHRVSAYLTGCCTDFGMLERGQKSDRRIIPFRILPSVAGYLAHELHFARVGDNALLTHEDWQLFGLGREDVLVEMKTHCSLKGLIVLQASGDIVRH